MMEEQKIVELTDEDLENISGGTGPELKEVYSGDIYVKKNDSNTILKVRVHTIIVDGSTIIPCTRFTKLSNVWQEGVDENFSYSYLVTYCDFCPDYFVNNPII